MRNRAWLLLLTPLLVLCALTSATAADAPVRSCASLMQLNLPNATITSATPMAAAAFVPPGLKPDQKIPPVFTSAPAFCRVSVTLKPTPDSDIKVEVWMPASGWNGKFRGIGNGGFAGYISYGGLAAAVSQGYAAASTDTGHSTEGAEWALGHPEKIVDYGYRGVHEMTVSAKAVVKAFYDVAAKPTYFASCSNGGRQALMEAQRFPDDYDGIIAGAPANSWVPMVTRGLKELKALDGAGYIPPTKIPAISEAVLSACDAQDGLKDGVVNDPRQCHFDPAVLLCKDKESDACLTSRQVDSLKTIYADAHDLAGGPEFPGLLPGAEDGRGGWAVWVTGSEEGKSLGTFFVTGYFADMVYGKKDWDYRTADLAAAEKLAQEKTGDSMTAMNPDLKSFLAHGGKLILYHGWNDPAISALNTVRYYNSAVAAVGATAADQSMRLYMVPGMQHCAGGPGATIFGQIEEEPRANAELDIFTSLLQWVENGKAPGTIIAAKYSGPGAKAPEMTRPLCPYPQAPEYKGAGDPKRAESFVCTAGGSTSK